MMFFVWIRSLQRDAGENQQDGLVCQKPPPLPREDLLVKGVLDRKPELEAWNPGRTLETCERRTLSVTFIKV